MGDIGVDVVIILKWFLKKYGRPWTGFMWLIIGTVVWLL